MRKCLIVILCFLMAFGLNIEVLAAESTINAYHVEQEKMAVFYSTETKFEDIYQGNDGSYALHLKDTGFTRVGRLDVDTASESNVFATLNDSRLTPEVKEYIRLKYEEAKAGGNTNINISIFSQELLPQTRDTTTEYRTYNGVEMRTDRVYVEGAETPWTDVSRGAKTKEVCNNISSIGLSFLGLAPITTISVAAGAASLLAAFINAGYNSYVTGSSSDFLQAFMKYDSTTQWTYARIGTDWQLGLVSQKAYVRYVKMKQYYMNNNNQGKSYTITTDIGSTYTSTYFNSPWAAAYQNMNNPLEEWGYWTVGSKRFYF